MRGIHACAGNTLLTSIFPSVRGAAVDEYFSMCKAVAGGLEALSECEHSRRAIRPMAFQMIKRSSVMIKLGKVSVETRGLKGIEPEEIQNVLFTQF